MITAVITCSSRTDHGEDPKIAVKWSNPLFCRCLLGVRRTPKAICTPYSLVWSLINPASSSGVVSISEILKLTTLTTHSYTYYSRLSRRNQFMYRTICTLIIIIPKYCYCILFTFAKFCMIEFSIRIIRIFRRIDNSEHNFFTFSNKLFHRPDSGWMPLVIYENLRKKQFSFSLFFRPLPWYYEVGIFGLKAKFQFYFTLFCEIRFVFGVSLVEVRLKKILCLQGFLFTCCTFLLYIFQIPFKTHFIRDFANKPSLLHSGARPTMAEKVLRRTSYGGEQSENIGTLLYSIHIYNTDKRGVTSDKK